MPETPKKAEFYWVIDSHPPNSPYYSPPYIEEVHCEEGRLFVECDWSGHGGTERVSPEQYTSHLSVTFGESIPSSATLAALRELAAKSPWHDCSGRGKGPYVCRFCGADGGWLIDTAPPPKEQHKPTCAWARSQEEK